MKEIYGIARTRDVKGDVVKISLVPYTMCIHTDAGGGRINMMILVIEVEDESSVGCDKRQD